MKKTVPAWLLAAVLLLSGCGSFLEREYDVTAPHSATYFGSDDRSVLRVESYQDLVNGLLMLISDRSADGTVWLYPSRDTPDAADAVSRACSEVQTETPMGAYAVSYLTYTIDKSAHNYSVIHLTIGYRRSAEQVAAMVHTTSVSALYDLLTAAAENGESELVIRVNYFDQTRDEVRTAVEQIQRRLVLGDPELPEEAPEGEAPTPEEPAEPDLPEGVAPWQVYFYPEEGDAGIVEVLLHGEEN